MKQITTKITLPLLIAAGLVALPALLRADDGSAPAAAPAATPATPPPAPAPAPAKHGKHGLTFKGSVEGIDTNAMTLTVGSRTFQITSATRITKDGQPAILADGVVGEPVSGSYKAAEGGTNLNAVAVHFGAKAKRKKKSEDSDMNATNAPAASSGN